MSQGLMERLSISIDRDWLSAQIDGMGNLTFGERIIAGKCLGRFEGEARSTEEVAFLGDGNLVRVQEIATMALSHCMEHAPDDGVRSELRRISFWLFKPE